MMTRTLPRKKYLSKLLGFLQTRFLRTSAPLRDDSVNPENTASAQSTQALRELKQTYSLERRNFL